MLSYSFYPVVMEDRISRYESFLQAPDVFKSRIDKFVDSGLKYIGDESVQCVFCDVVFSNWEMDDCPFKRHIERNARCPFLMCAADLGLKCAADICGISKPEQTLCLYPKYNREEYRLNSFPEMFAMRDKLAKAGFYYLGSQDETQCFYCGLKLKDWKCYDDPFVEHRKFNAYCLHLLRFKDTSSFLPLFPNYMKEKTRLNSFPEIFLMRDKLAKAGFYYLGETDKTQCFMCGVVAKDWKCADDPMVEHYKYNSKCSYLLKYISE